MKKRAWKTRIKKACMEAGTYKPAFDFVIDSLASTLEKRDEVEAAYAESEDGPTIEYTNKNGSTNIVKNPLLVMWDDLNKSALVHWRDLGLTPAGLKKIKENSFAGGANTAAGPNDLLGKLREKQKSGV